MYRGFVLHLLILGWLMCLVSPAVAQQTDSVLYKLNADRIQLNKTNMWVLGGWALGNIGISSVMRARSSGTMRYFHEMNVIWNVVNLGLAVGGLYGSFQADPGSFDLWSTYAEQQKIEKILLFNLALNFTYLTAGGYLMERSRRTIQRPERLQGYGQSLLLQGGFLLLFDATQYFLHHYQSHDRLRQLLEGVQLSGAGIGYQWWF